MSNLPVAILIEDEFQELELHYPRLRLIEAGYEVTVVGADKTDYKSALGYPGKADAKAADVDADDFSAIVIPGGMAPDRMRRHVAMVDLVSTISAQNKPVAWICHAGWMAASADIIRDRDVTSFSSIRVDMENAGARWHDKPVVRDGNLVSSRVPDDLPVFCKTLLELLGES